MYFTFIYFESQHCSTPHFQDEDATFHDRKVLNPHLSEAVCPLPLMPVEE